MWANRTIFVLLKIIFFCFPERSSRIRSMQMALCSRQSSYLEPSEGFSLLNCIYLRKVWPNTLASFFSGVDNSVFHLAFLIKGWWWSIFLLSPQIPLKVSLWILSNYLTLSVVHSSKPTQSPLIGIEDRNLK